MAHEETLWSSGYHFVAGLDEVGRGAWAGPVSVGIAVVTPEAADRAAPQWLRDSKALTEARRERVFDEVVTWCDAWAVGSAAPAECDRFGMTAALRLGALRAFSALGRRMDAVLIDGNFDYLAEREHDEAAAAHSRRAPWSEVRDDFAQALAPLHHRPPATRVPVVRGDACCAAVAAASILAKVVRDRHMRAESEHFPAFDFHSNKGYPSAAHRRALMGYGLTSIHRRTWAYTDQLCWS